MGFSADQIAKVREVWSTVMASKTAIGVDFFIRLFRAHPGLVDKFERFRSFKSQLTEDYQNLTPGAGQGGDAISRHAEAVIDSVNEVINVLEDETMMVDILHTVGKIHSKIPDFNPEYFKEVIEPLMGALKQAMGDSWDPEMEQLFTAALNLIVEKVTEGCTQ